MADVKIVIGAQDDASRVLSRVQAGLGSVQSVASKVGGVLGIMGGISVGACASMVKGSIDSVDALNDIKDATGASIENISALEDVAARTGTEMGTVTTALVKLNGVLKDADPGSKQEAALKAIGLSAKELKDLDPAEALLKTATALQGFADDGNKARIVQELFGKSLKEVAPLLKDLAEQGKLVATVTTEQAEAAEKFNKQLFSLQKNATDAGRSITGALVPALSEGVERFLLAQKHAGGLLETLALYARLDYSKNIAGNLAEVEQQLAQLEDRAKRVTSESARKGNDKQIADLRAQAAYLKELRQLKILESQGDNSDAVSRKFLGKKSVGDIPEAAKAVKATRAAGKSEAQKAAEEEQKFRIKLGRDYAIEEGERVSAKADARAKALQDIENQQKAYLGSIAKEVNAQQDLNEKMREEVQEIGLSTEALNALRLARLDAAIATQEQAIATADANNGSLTELEYLEQRLMLLKETRDLTAAAQIKRASADTEKTQKEASKAFATELHGDLKGAFSAAFRDTSGDPLQAFGDALSNVVYTRIATAAAESLATSFLGSAGGASSGGGQGSLLAALMSFDGGGYTGSGARAGGLDGKGGFMAMLHPNETVLDHSKGQGAGQAVTVVQNFTVGDVASVSLVRQAVAGSERRIAAAMGRSMNYGGALA